MTDEIEGPWSRQKQHPQFGAVYRAFYTVIELVQDKLVWKSNPRPRPIFRFGPLPGDMIASYNDHDEYYFPHVLTVDPLKVRTALDAVEFVVHEVVHCWQFDLGYPLVDNRHEENFHNAMADFGIATQGLSGRHVGYIGDIWDEWMDELSYLKLAQMLLSDEPKDKQALRIYECQVCALTINHEDPDLVLFCGHPHKPVPIGRHIEPSSYGPSIMKLIG